MGIREILGRLARAAPIPVFPVAGADAIEAVRDLRLRPEIELVATPRHASILLVAGDFGVNPIPGLALVHDQMPLPRVTVHWNDKSLGDVHGHVVGGDEADLVEALSALDREILTAPDGSEPPILPDVDLVDWRGVGPYGHGGKGMTGGTPFGRPLAERAPDRDGLELDQLPITIGPWVGALPPGLQVAVKFQGDVIQEIEVVSAFGPTRPDDVFAAALHTPTPVAILELERARRHLRWLADALRFHGLPALGLWALRLAHDLSPQDQTEVEDLLRSVRRSWVIKMVLSRIDGGFDDRSMRAGLGPLTRAAGLEDDARMDDPAYQALDFQPILGRLGDPAGWWRQRMAEIIQSLDISSRAGDMTAFGVGSVEGPRGRLQADNPGTSTPLELLPGLLTGLEWGDAAAVVWSLDIDPFASMAADLPVGVES